MALLNVFNCCVFVFFHCFGPTVPLTFNSEYPVKLLHMHVGICPSHLYLNRCNIDKVEFNFLSFLYRLTKSWTEQRRRNPGKNRRRTEETTGQTVGFTSSWKLAGSQSHSIIQHVLSLLLLPAAWTPAHLSWPRKRVSAVPDLTTGGRCCHCTPHGRSGSLFRPLSL